MGDLASAGAILESMKLAVLAMLAVMSGFGTGPGVWVVDGAGLREIRVAFDAPVAALTPDAVSIRTARRGVISGFVTRYDPAENVLTITFEPAIRADRVTVELDDSIAAAASARVARYLVLAGDANRDGAVDAADLHRVVASTGVCRPDPAFDAEADLDGSGCVDPGDVALVAGNLGRTLPPAGGGTSLTVPARIGRGVAPAAGQGSPGAPPGGVRHESTPFEARAVYDGGQHGSLPPVSVVRDYATIDALGGAVGPHEPRWGRPQIRAPLQEWTLARSTTQHIPWVISGVDNDGTTPMLGYLRSGPERIAFWIGAPIDDGTATFIVDVSRESIQDLLVGTALEQEFYAYDPEGGIALPGCFLFLCKRWHDENEDPQLRDWQIEGISVVAFQRDVNGDFAFEIVGDGAPLNGDDTALGLDRADPWAMTAYYPVVAGQDPLLRVFVPVVDYINSGSTKPGGQVFLFDATRPDAATPWSFGELVLIDEHVEDGTHFHTAAWTPRGVVAALGDTSDKNENILYTCADWDDYANPFMWMKHDRAYGAGTHPDEPALTAANQFAGAVPGRDPTHFLVAGDVQGGGVYECEVPEDPADGLTFTRLWGEHWADDVTGGHVGVWFHKPAPPRDSRSVTRVFPAGVGWVQQNHAARVLYSDDDTNFMTIARLPSTLHHGAYVVLHGDEIVLFHRNGSGNQTPTGIWSMPAPVTRGPGRGLSVGPGATNLLDDAGGGLASATTGGGTGLTLVTDGLHPMTGEPLDAPGWGPVYRVEANGSSTLYLGFQPTGGVTVAPGFVYVPMWLRVLGPEGVEARVEVTDSGQGTPVPWQLKVTNREQWVPYTVMLNTGAFGGDYTPYVRIKSGSDVARAADFLIQVEGFYAGERTPYATAPGTTSPSEQVTQPLGALGQAWTVGLELHLPFAAEDWLGHPDAAQDGGRLALATLVAGDGDYVEVYAELNLRRIGMDVYQGGALAITGAIGNVVVQRFDRIWIALAQTSPSELSLYAWSGGSTEGGFAKSTSPIGLAAPPTELRFGSHDFSRVPTVDVLMVAVERARGLDKDEVISLLSTDGAAGLPPQAEP